MEPEIRFRMSATIPESLFRLCVRLVTELMTDQITQPVTGSGAPRAMRADARRNRERILEAARAAWSEHGSDVQMDDVAQRAGVGVGTVYRHFPTKTDLAGALGYEHFQALCAVAEEALAADGTPGERFEAMIWAAARLAERDAAIAQALAGDEAVFDQIAEPLARLQVLSGQLVDAAVASGELRADATGADIPPIMCGLGQVMATSGRRPGAGWERYLTIALDGMRAPRP